ncbi:MAG: zinc-dependent alcohol dehydrogenase [Longimicrobiales bacterium]
MRAIRLHYRPVRYLLSRYLGRGPGLSLGSLGFISLDDVAPPPLPGRDWVRVRPLLSGICGSDLAAVMARDSFLLEPFQTYPFTFGHENIGRLKELGPEVAGWSPGDRVAIRPMLACEQRGLEPACRACAAGEYGLCTRTTDGGLSPGFMIGFCADTGGGWADEFVAHRSQVLRMPSQVGDDVAVLLDAFASALRPVLLHPPAEGDTVLVIGAGSIGLLTVRALRLSGWQGDIAVLGRYDFQNQRAEAAGASRILRNREELYRWATSLPGARGYKPTLAPRFIEGGPTLVYDTVANEGSLGDTLAVTAGGGRVIVVGTTTKLSADWTRLVLRSITVAGVFAYGLAPFDGGRRDIYDIALELLGTGGLDALDLVTHVFDLEEYRAALAAALDKAGARSIKVALRPGG